MIVINNSGIKLWRRCPQAYYYKEVEGIEPRLHSLPLQKGTWMHLLLESYLKGEKWMSVHEILSKAFNQLMDEEKELYGDLSEECYRLMNGYIKTYEGKILEVLAVEMNFAKTPVEIAQGVFLKGKVDAVVKERDKKVWIMEHKNMKKIPPESDRFLNIQTVIYTTAVERILDVKVAGTLWDYLRTKTPTIPDILKNGTVTRKKKIDTDYETYLSVILKAGQDPNDYLEELERVKQNTFYVRRYMPRSQRVMDGIIKEAIITARMVDKLKMFPYRNLNPMSCRGCEYRTLCESELLGLDCDFIRKTEFKPVDPNKQGYPAHHELLDIIKKGGGIRLGKASTEEDDDL